jgi:flavorubredoxin
MEIFPPIEQLLIALRTREIKNKTVGVFGSYTWGSAAHKKVSAYFEQMKLPVIANLDMKQSVRTLANDAIEQFANDFYCGLIDNTQ